MNRKTKMLTWRNLKPGMEINGWTEGRHTRMAKSRVVSANPAFVVLLVFGTQEEKVSSSCMFEVNLTKEELSEKFGEAAKAILKSITNVVESDIGYHEMWNAWLSNDPVEMAITAAERNIKILGHTTNIAPKRSFFSENLLDCGVVAEDADGERFWCHWSCDALLELLWRYLYPRNEWIGLTREYMDDITKRREDVANAVAEKKYIVRMMQAHSSGYYLFSKGPDMVEDLSADVEEWAKERGLKPFTFKEAAELLDSASDSTQI
jgi:hypothetical protein